MPQMFYHLFPQCFTKGTEMGKHWGNILEKWGNISPLRDKNEM